jgi:hypothetical protein
VLAICSISFGQQLLLNPSFDDPPPAGGDCSQDQQIVGHWHGADGITPWAKRNRPVYPATCSCATNDPAHVTMDGWGDGSRMIQQTVTGFMGGGRYALTGAWWLGHLNQSGNNTARAELHDGTAAGPILDNDSGVQKAFAERIQYQGSTEE